MRHPRKLIAIRRGSSPGALPHPHSGLYRINSLDVELSGLKKIPETSSSKSQYNTAHVSRGSGVSRISRYYRSGGQHSVHRAPYTLISSIPLISWYCTIISQISYETIRTITILQVVLFLFFIARPAAAQQENEIILENIHNAYERLDFSVAEARIEAALGDYNRFTPVELSDIHRIYALIFYARNDLDSARSQLNQALQLSPTMTLDAVETPPQLLEIFLEVKQEYDAQITQNAREAQVRYVIVHDPRPAAVMRSMIVPGWGQLYKGEEKKGRLLMGLWSLTAGGAVVAHIGRKRAEDRYLDALTPDEIANRYNTFDSWHKIRNNIFISALGVWAFSYADALLAGQPETSQRVVTSPLNFSVTPAPHSPRFSLEWRF